MNKEIITDPLEPEDLWDDLTLNIQKLKELAVTEVIIFFGFAWGSEIYPDKWEEFVLPTDQVEARIKEVEAKGYGRMGSDNVYISVPEFDARVQYSYEGHIHLSYQDRNDFTAPILDRWEEREWLLVHRSKNLRKKKVAKKE